MELPTWSVQNIIFRSLDIFVAFSESLCSFSKSFMAWMGVLKQLGAASLQQPAEMVAPPNPPLLDGHLSVHQRIL